jgi:glucan phosphoethanolaminetransferase (alkaline phosphatase superfamily)
MAQTDASKKGSTQFTVYQDKFVILYGLVAAGYLFLGFLVFILPLFDPSSKHDLKLSFMIVPLLYSGLITLAVCGIAIRAVWAPRFFIRTSRLFLPVLALSSLIAFLRFGLAGSLAVTAALLLLFLPYMLILSYGRRYLKREDVQASFESANR